MPSSTLSGRAGLFPALLKHWRGQRGLSQLDLALAADVSSRHISFLETGRSNPSAEMVLRLSKTLGIALRQTNALLEAAGHDALFAETPETLPVAAAEALRVLKAHHDPYPLFVMDRAYRVRDLNRGAQLLLAAVLPELSSTGAASGSLPAGVDLNLARATFDPRGAQPYLVNFDELGRALLWRLQRELLADPDDAEVRALLDELLAMPTVGASWREVDLSVAADPALVVHLRRDQLELRFLTMITAFQAPQNVAVEDLRIEMWLPHDEETVAAMHGLASAILPPTQRPR